MLTLLVLVLLYFLPAILARNKQNFLGVFLVNFLLGWTVIGWVAALVWALSEPERPYVIIPAPSAPAAATKFCCACGVPTASRYCPHCGRVWA
ncbi:MAG: superinfection immunity protein [Terriglobales bacterium]